MKVENLVPDIYYKDSRDFAFMGRCFEVIFNYMKTGAQCVNVNYLTDAIDSTTIDLMVDTVGFTSKHKYDDKNLLAVAQSFQKLLRNKGSLYAIELAVTILMTAQKITSNGSQNPICEIDPDDPFNIIINVSDRLADVVLLEDIFDYILPAGMTYVIVRNGQEPSILVSSIGPQDIVMNNDDLINTEIIVKPSDTLTLNKQLESRGLNVGQIVRYTEDTNEDTNN